MTTTTSSIKDKDQECQERQEAELEFVSSAYAADEAWCDTGSTIVAVHRHLRVPVNDTSLFNILLTLQLPENYPVSTPLEVMDAKVEVATAATAMLQKAAINAMPSLLETCRQTASDNVGQESIFLVFSTAEEWIQDFLLPKIQSLNDEGQQSPGDNVSHAEPPNEATTLGRRLIYSHHIIAKTKRADIKALASELKLTGYLKVGWPGLLIIEGIDDHCNQFYDAIRPWSWQYLVMRGEQQEVVPRGSSLDDVRKFSTFVEVEEMATVAEHCREVGLEALFRTSMKQYDNQTGHKDSSSATLNSPHDDVSYGALILVDHMNDGKGYRKWLRKCSRQMGCFLLMKQFYPGNDYSNSPTILVGIFGAKDNVGTFLKRWRTSRVDVNSKGKACLERQMKVLVEGELHCGDFDGSMDWDAASSEDKFTITEEQLADTLSPFGWSLNQLIG